MTTATAILGGLVLPSTDARYTQLGHDADRCRHDMPPPPARRSPALGTVTLSADQYAYLISLIHVQPSPAPASPTLTRAHASPCRASPGPAPTAAQTLSLADQFPHVAPDLLLAVARHTLDPLELYQLDEHYHASCSTPPPTARADPLAAPVRVTAREFITRYYPSFSALVSPLSTYFRILLALASSAPASPPASPTSPHAPSPSAVAPGRADVLAIASASTHYLAQLVALSEEHHWAVILPYHMAFHRARLAEMQRGDYSGWATVDVELLVRLIEEREEEELRAECRQDGSRSR